MRRPDGAPSECHRRWRRWGASSWCDRGSIGSADKAVATPRPPFAPPLARCSMVPWSAPLATRSTRTCQDPHSGPGWAQFNLGLLKCSLDNGQGHQHAQRSLDLSKPLLIMRSVLLCGPVSRGRRETSASALHELRITTRALLAAIGGARRHRSTPRRARVARADTRGGSRRPPFPE